MLSSKGEPYAKKVTDKTYLRMPAGREIIISQPGREPSEIVKKESSPQLPANNLISKFFSADKMRNKGTFRHSYCGLFEAKGEAKYLEICFTVRKKHTFSLQYVLFK